jgi:hypothetical protein
MSSTFEQSIKAVGWFALIVFGCLVLLMLQISRTGESEIDEQHADFQLVQQLLDDARLELQESYNITGNWSGDVDRGFVASALEPGPRALNLFQIAERGDQLSGELAATVRFVADNIGNGQITWFPTADEILSADYRVQPMSINPRTGEIESPRLLILRPADQMVFTAG